MLGVRRREPTIIARYGNEGGDYGSGLVFAVTSGKECYREALKRSLKTKYKDDIVHYFERYEKGEFPERYERFLKIMEEK